MSVGCGAVGRQLKLVFDLEVVEEELEGRCVSGAAPGRAREGPLCSLAQDGGFCGRMRPRALQKTCKDRLLEEVGQ